MERKISLMLSFTNLVNLDFWSVAFLKEQKNSFKNGFEIIPISTILKRGKKIIQINNSLNYKRITVKLYSKGVILRDELKGIDIGIKRQYVASKGQFIISKIDARNGAFGIIPDVLEGAIVTNDFPLFDINTNLIIPNFFFLLTTTNVFIELAKSCSSGTTNRQRIDIDKFLNFKIPLPSISEQKNIVDAYFTKIHEANLLEEQAKNIDQEIEKYFLDQLGFEQNRDAVTKCDAILNFTSFEKLVKWSLNHLNRNSSIDFENSNFKREKIKNLIEFFEGGKTPSKSNKSFWIEEVYWTSPKDFTNVIFLESSEDKISQKAVIESGMKIYPEDTFLSVFRSGILKHSFPTVLTKIPTTINQDVKAYRLDGNKIRNKYYLYFVNTFPKYILENSSKKSVTVESINTDEFLNIEIPVPPIFKQEEIISVIEDLEDKIENKQTMSKQLKQQANEEFVKAIFQ